MFVGTRYIERNKELVTHVCTLMPINLQYEIPIESMKNENIKRTDMHQHFRRQLGQTECDQLVNVNNDDNNDSNRFEHACCNFEKFFFIYFDYKCNPDSVEQTTRLTEFV